MGAKCFICNSAQLSETTNQKEHIRQQLINIFQKCIKYDRTGSVSDLYLYLYYMFNNISCNFEIKII
jgi:hypothetical protein